MGRVVLTSNLVFSNIDIYGVVRLIRWRWLVLQYLRRVDAETGELGCTSMVRSLRNSCRMGSLAAIEISRSGTQTERTRVRIIAVNQPSTSPGRENNTRMVRAHDPGLYRESMYGEFEKLREQIYPWAIVRD